MGFTNEYNLIKNQECTITYSGNLYKNNSEQVTIVYGFGDNWDSTSEELMTKTENGFEAKIKMLNYDKLNFCFRNSNYEWDNNNSANYSLPIEDESEPELEIETELEPETKSEPELEIETKSDEEENNKNDLLNVILSENKSELNYIQEFDIDNLIEEILSPLLEENISAFSETDIEETTVDESITSLLDSELNATMNQEIEFDSNQFKQIAQSLNEQIENSMFELVDTVQNEIVEESLPVSNINDIDVSIIEENNETTSLTVRDEDAFIVCSRKLNQFYVIRKKIKLALCKILYAIPRLINKEFNMNKD